MCRIPGTLGRHPTGSVRSSHRYVVEQVRDVCFLQRFGGTVSPRYTVVLVEILRVRVQQSQNWRHGFLHGPPVPGTRTTGPSTQEFLLRSRSYSQVSSSWCRLTCGVQRGHNPRLCSVFLQRERRTRRRGRQTCLEVGKANRGHLSPQSGFPCQKRLRPRCLSRSDVTTLLGNQSFLKGLEWSFSRIVLRLEKGCHS